MPDQVGPSIEVIAAAIAELDEEESLQLGEQLASPEHPAREAPAPADLQGASTDELVELTRNTEIVEAARAEVCRRLQDRAEKANLMTVRFLLPGDDADRVDAFDGLMALCWNETKFRHVSDKRLSEKDEYEYVRDAIQTELVDRLHGLRALTPQEVIDKGLNGGFSRIAADVANCVRRQVRQQRTQPSLSLDYVYEDQQRDQDILEFVSEKKPEIVEAVGDAGYQVLLTFVEVAEDGDPPLNGKRNREALYTRKIAERLGVSERQAREYKRRLREAFQTRGAPVFAEIVELLQERTRFLISRPRKPKPSPGNF